MKNVDAADYVVGVVGAGAMGQGIVQVAVQGGMRALIVDARAGGAETARQTITGRLDRRVEDMGAETVLRVLEQLQTITGEDRYRPTMWMKRRARLGLPVHTEG
jgi:3-hydroxyacyl-CoA dehydrogenase